MRKKVWGIALSLLLAISLLAGCSGGNKQASSSGKSQKGERVTLTMWYWNRSVEDKLIKDVSKVYPNITINATKIGGDYNAKLKTTMAAGSGMPDIVCINTNVADYYQYKDKFVNLLAPPYNAGDLKDQYFEWKWQMGVTPDQKTMIAFPMDTGPTALFYREDLFQKAGLPTDPQQVANTIKTWKDYFDAAQKLKNIGVYAFDNIGDNVFINATQQKTTLFLDTNNNFVGDRQEIKDIFDMAVQARKLGYSANVARYTTDWNAAMNTGKVASFVGAVWMKQILEDAAPDTSGKWRIAPAPGGPGNSGGSFIAISASSKHPQEAWQAIKWMMSAENQKRQLKTMNLFPSAKAVFDDESVFVKEPFFGGQETNRVFADAAKNIPVFYYGPNTEGIRGLYTEQLKLVESQNKAADKAWQDALKNIKKQYFSGR